MLSSFKCVLEKRSSRVQTFYIEESFASFRNHSKVNRYKLTSLVTHCQRSNIRLWRSLDSFEMPCQDVNNFPASTDVIVRRRRKESHARCLRGLRGFKFYFRRVNNSPIFVLFGERRKGSRRSFGEATRGQLQNNFLNEIKTFAVGSAKHQIAFNSIRDRSSAGVVGSLSRRFSKKIFVEKIEIFSRSSLPLFPLFVSTKKSICMSQPSR